MDKELEERYERFRSELERLCSAAGASSQTLMEEAEALFRELDRLKRETEKLRQAARTAARPAAAMSSRLRDALRE